jgi:hypothetical protein
MHAEGERMILTRAAGERQEIDLAPPTPPATEAVVSAELPTPVCPQGEVTGFGSDSANAEQPAPGASPLDEDLERLHSAFDEEGGQP